MLLFGLSMTAPPPIFRNRMTMDDFRAQLDSDTIQQIENLDLDEEILRFRQIGRLDRERREGISKLMEGFV